jgi:biopolymer transport protein ExbD
MKLKRKSLDFEVNLLPVISILAVCISLLLLTTVWIHVGVFNTSQALGTESDSTSDTKALWLEMNNDGSVHIKVIQGDKTEARWMVQGLANSRADINRIKTFTSRIIKTQSKIEKALVLPAPKSKYQDMIAVMDGLKSSNIQQIGISPL